MKITYPSRSVPYEREGRVFGWKYTGNEVTIQLFDPNSIHAIIEELARRGYIP